MKFTDFPPQARGGRIRADWARKIESAIAEQRPRPLPGQTMSRDSYGVLLGQVEKAKEIELKAARPFLVRWFYTNDDMTEGEWQIYLPYGCVCLTTDGVPASCIPVNRNAKDTEGNELYRWYRIDDPKDEDARIAQEGGYAAKEWTVYVHIKPWPRMKAGTAQEDKDFKRSEWSVPVATISAVAFEKWTSHRSIQLIDDTIIREWSTGAPFSIEYRLDSKTSASSAVKAYLVNQSKFIGRLFKENVEPVDITGWKNVWVKIEHKDEKFNLTIEKDLRGSEAESDDDKTVFRIYTLEDDIPKQDLRPSIPEMDFYTNGPDEPGQEDA